MATVVDSKILKKNKKKLVARVRISIEPKDENQIGTMGKGVAALLDGVKTFGSLNKSAKNLKMAYSKAWRIVKETEEGFDFLLIDRDGARGSKLTPEGEQLLAIYNKIQVGTTSYVDKQFDLAI